MAKQKTKDDPFGPQAKTKAVPKASEEDTPVTGTYVPKGVVTQAQIGPNVPDTGPAADLARDLAEVGKARSDLRVATRELEQAQAVIQDQAGQIATLRESLALANSSHEVTDADISRLHDMFAEISFDRSRDGHSFLITLKGSRSQSGGRVNKFGSFEALLQHLRTKG